MILKWWIFPKNNEWFCRFIKGNLSFIYVKSLVSFVLRTCRPLFIYFGKWLNSFRGFIKVFKVEEMILQKINFEKIKMQTLLTAHTSWSACNRVDIFVILFLATKVKPFMVSEKKRIQFLVKNFYEFWLNHKSFASLSLRSQSWHWSSWARTSSTQVHIPGSKFFS